MIVKISENYYDSNEQPILLVLLDKEKQDISLMGDSKRYCSFPNECETKDIIAFMGVPEDILEKID